MVGQLGADIEITYAIVPYKGFDFNGFFKYTNDRLTKALPDMTKATGPIIDMVKKVPKDVGFTNINKFMDKLEAFKMPPDVYKPTPFAGWAMSIMFFGMAIQRTMDTIWKSSTKTFQDVMHSVEGTVTQFDIMNGSMAYLGFTAGQALEPLVALMIPIIDAAQEWIQNNEKLFQDIIYAAALFGTIFMVGGSGMLAFNGFKDLLAIVKSIPTSIAELGNSGMWSGIGKTISTAIGTIGIAVGLYTTAQAVKDFVEAKDTEGTLRAALKGAGGVLETIGGLRVIKGQKGGYLMMAIGFALDKTSEGTFFQSILTLFGAIAGTIGGILMEMVKNLLRYAEAHINIVLSTLGFGKIDLGIDEMVGFKEILSGTIQQTKEWGKELDKIYNEALESTNNEYSGQFMSSAQAGQYYTPQQSSATNIYNFYGYTNDDIMKSVNANR